MKIQDLILINRINKESKKPFMFIDKAKSHSDEVTLVRAIVSMITFMINHVENTVDEEETGKKVKDALQKANKLLVRKATIEYLLHLFVI